MCVHAGIQLKTQVCFWSSFPAQLPPLRYSDLEIPGTFSSLNSLCLLQLSKTRRTLLGFPFRCCSLESASRPKASSVLRLTAFVSLVFGIVAWRTGFAVQSLKTVV